MNLRKFLTRASLLSALLAGSMAAGEKSIMHCFAYTPVATATQADWDAFHKASDAMPSKIKGVVRVWHGKLRALLNLVVATDGADRKKVVAGEKDVTGKLGLQKREYGMCIEFKDKAAWDGYAADAYHKEWEAAYGKVRVPGTTTYQIMGQ